MNILEYAIAKKMFGGSGGAKAYHLTSADDLPTDAVDGSLAVVESDSIEGRWQFHENIDFGCFSMPDNSFISFYVKGESDECGLFTNVYIRNIDGAFDITVWLANETEYVVYSDGSWAGGESGLNFFTGIQSCDACYFDDGGIDYPTLEKDINVFFTTNADRISGGHTLYSRENGEWVNKGEI